MKTKTTAKASYSLVHTNMKEYDLKTGVKKSKGAFTLVQILILILIRNSERESLSMFSFVQISER